MQLQQRFEQVELTILLFLGLVTSLAFSILSDGFQILGDPAKKREDLTSFPD